MCPPASPPNGDKNTRTPREEYGNDTVSPNARSDRWVAGGIRCGSEPDYRRRIPSMAVEGLEPWDCSDVRGLPGSRLRISPTGLDCGDTRSILVAAAPG